MLSSVSSRLTYIDWMRGLACVLMFQTHCYDSWLGGGARQSRFFMWSQDGGTFPAPLFLFLAGMSLALVTSKLLARRLTPRQIARILILRGAEILGARAPVPAAGISDCLGLGALERSAAGGHSEQHRRIADVDGGGLLVGFGAAPAISERRIRGPDHPHATHPGDGGGGGGFDDLAPDSASVDDLASGLAGLANRFLHRRRAPRAAAGGTVSDFPLDGVRLHGTGRRLFLAEWLGAGARGGGLCPGGSGRRGPGLFGPLARCPAAATLRNL